MYRLNQRPVKSSPLRRFIFRLITIVVVIVLLVFLYLHFRVKTTIDNAARPVVSSIAAGPTQQTFNETDYSFQLPTDWKLVNQSNGPYDMYSFQEQTKNQDNRILNIYVDTIPANFAVNKVLPLMPSGGSVTEGSLSDDCATFTGSANLNNTQELQSQPNTAAKWEGVSFICDLSHYNRNAIGTGSAAGVNTVTLTGPSGHTHSYFFVYTDENIQPDYSILENALSSFHSK